MASIRVETKNEIKDKTKNLKFLALLDFKNLLFYSQIWIYPNSDWEIFWYSFNISISNMYMIGILNTVFNFIIFYKYPTFENPHKNPTSHLVEEVFQAGFWEMGFFKPTSTK